MQLRPLLGHIVLAALVSAVYLYCYIVFLNPFFEYAGFALYRREPGFLALALVFAILPVLLYTGVRQLSSILAAFVYVMLYIPIILTFAIGSAQPTNHIVLVQIVFMVGMALIFLVDRVAIENPFNFEIDVDLFRWLLALTAAATAYMLFVYRGNLRLVSFDAAVYELRSANADLGAGMLTRYLSSWLSNVMVPLCLAYGLFARRYIYFLLGSAACVILYMATAAKIMILLPVVYLAFYVVFSSGRIYSFYPLLAGGLSVFIAAMTALGSLGGLSFIIASIFLNRTIGSGGQVTVAYYDFFSFFPQTNFSHINLVQMVTGAYPYAGRGVGQVVGQYVYDPLMNANANFWATDGIAALGLVGVLVASVAFAAVLAVMNTLTREVNPLFVLLCFVPFITQILNTSLFSSLWSGGGFFVLLFFVLHGRKQVAPRSERRAVLEVAAPAT